MPEAVELPGRKVRKGDKVRILPPRGQTSKKSDEKPWRVVGIDRSAGTATLERLAAPAPDSEEPLIEEGEAHHKTRTAALDDLVVVAQFRDAIYPGLVSTGKVERGGDKPFHSVINAENFHALETLLFTHRAKADCIYIDPPYNTGAKDWTYNNDYVEADDLYRHSKWLAFMERRLLLAKELLNPSDSVLIVTIDEKEYLRLGLLLGQTFPEARIQMVSSVINPKGAVRANEFSRTDEYIFFVLIGRAGPEAMPTAAAVDQPVPVPWQPLRRSDIASRRGTSKGGVAQFYPIYVETATERIVHVGDALVPSVERRSVAQRSGCVAVFPVRPDGTEMNWGLTAPSLKSLLSRGFVKAGSHAPDKPQQYGIMYFTSGRIAEIEEGRAVVTGRRADGSVEAFYRDGEGRVKMPETNWRESSHNSQHYGTLLLKELLPDRSFPFPKSLYAVEDTLRLFVGKKQAAVVVDFFSGSGTTAHAVMRLNKQDDGRRVSISVTNNEVSADEEAALRNKELRPGDPEWEQWGISEYITKPRIRAAITGETSEGDPIKSDYKFADVFPMSDGFNENVEFFTLTYEAPLRVASNREFAKIASLLWMRAGSRGRRIDDISKGWDVADVYGVLANLDLTEDFLKAVAANEAVAIAFVVTDEERLFESVAQNLPDRVEPVRLYEAYLRNFEIESGRGLL
jgi:adenine-specific DNA-methyltransferase